MRRDIVTIGASLGGFQAVTEVLKALPRDLPAAVFVVVHIDPNRHSPLPEMLSPHSAMPVMHPVHGQAIEHGTVYVAPPDMQVYLSRDTIEVVRGPRENGARPAVDALFRTASRAYGPRVIGLVLSGALDCGTAGMLSIKARGGIALVQEPSSAQVPAMPESCIRHVEIDSVAPPGELGAIIQRYTSTDISAQAIEPTTFLRMLEGDEPGRAAAFVCPACDGTLSETESHGFSLYRCHVGHAFSLQTVLEAQSARTERALWSAVRALEESAALAARVVTKSSGTLRERMAEKERTLRAEAATLKQLLLGERGMPVQREA